MKVVLLGYMASGKSSIGRALAKKLGFAYVDLDNEIVEHVGRTIPEIFAEKGEIFFRKTESKVLEKTLLDKENFVLAVGGGTPCYANNMDLINQNSDCSIYLKASIRELVARISQEKQHRPLVADIPDAELPEFIGKHLFERTPFYSEANEVVGVDNKSIDEITAAILSLIKKDPELS